MMIDVQPGDIANDQARKQAWYDAVSPVFEGTIDSAVTVLEPVTARRMFPTAVTPEAAVRHHLSRLGAGMLFAYADMLGLDLCRPRRGEVPTPVPGVGDDAAELIPGRAQDMMPLPGLEHVADRIVARAKTSGSAGTTVQAGLPSSTSGTSERLPAAVAMAVLQSEA